MNSKSCYKRNNRKLEKNIFPQKIKSGLDESLTNQNILKYILNYRFIEILLGEMIPKLKSRQPGAQAKAGGSQENPSTQGGGGGGGKKNKKKK